METNNSIGQSAASLKFIYYFKKGSTTIESISDNRNITESK